MTAAGLLVLYTGVVATLGSSRLRRAAWPERAPHLAIAVWQALSASALAAVVLAGAALAVRVSPFGTDLAALFRACLTNLRAGYATPGEAVTTTVGIAIVIAVIGRASWCVTRALVERRHQGRRQVQLLTVLAHRNQNLDALVLQHDSSVAFCLPGRGHRIVLTTAAVAALQPGELTAVLAHERAHLRWHHHLVVTAARGFAQAFPGVPLFGDAHRQVARLVEMAADDAARRCSHPETVANALLVLADGAVPAPALAAGKCDVEARVLRLRSSRRPLDRSRRCLLAGLVAAVLVAPVALAAAPAIAAAQIDHCPIAEPSASTG